MWYSRSRISKLATKSISMKNFTYKNHPNASFSSLVGFKSQQISSIYGYTYYTNKLNLVKQYHNSSVPKWYKNMLGAVSYYTPKKPSSPGYGLVIILRRIIYFLSTALVGLVSFSVYKCSEKIPYTNRTHIVVAPPVWDKMCGDSIFERLQLSTLSEEHPDSVRVKMIGEKIVEALESDLEAMKNQNVSIDHLVGLKWKFVVVDDSIVAAHSVIGGNIFVNTGLLKKFESDAEIATIIAREVGHTVARHLANRNNMLVLAFTTRALLGLAEPKMKMADHNPRGVSKWIRVLFQYPRFRRQESEADDIGLLVMASAGYDPQAAPKVYEIFEEGGFFFEHPSGKKRAKKLARGKVMKEASSIYSKVIQTRKMNDLIDS